jgi:site-specific recombinase XerD
MTGGHRKTSVYIYTRCWVDFGLFLRYRFGEGYAKEWSNRDQTYRSGISPFALEYLEENIGNVTPTDVEAYVAALFNIPTKRKVGLSNSTINLRLAALNFLFKIAVREKYATQNCASSEFIDRHKVRSRPRAYRLESDDVRVLLAELEGDDFVSMRNRTIVLFLFLTGCRREELVRLTVDDLITLPKKKGVAVTLSRKGDFRQEIILSKELEGPFLEYVNALRPDRYVFPQATITGNPTNEALSADRVTAIVGHLTEKVLGRHHSPHDFRHAFCTTALHRGAPLHSVQIYLGHSNPQTTMGYYDSVLEREGSAAEFVSLDD